MAEKTFQIDTTDDGDPAVETRQFQSGKREGKDFLRVKPRGGRWASVSDPRTWEEDCNTILLTVKEDPDAFFRGDFESDEKYGDSIRKVSVSQNGAEAAASASKPAGGGGRSDTARTEEAFRIAWSVVYKTEREQQVHPDMAMRRALEFASIVVSGGKAYADSDIPFEKLLDGLKT